jgi:hypothetical protein
MGLILEESGVREDSARGLPGLETSGRKLAVLFQ